MVRIPQLWHPPSGEHTFRQTQTLFGVKGYVQRGIDFGQSYLPVFGDQQNVPFELPVYQAAAAVVSSAGTSVDLASRMVSLAAFQVSALALWALLRRWQGMTAGILGLAVFEFLPFGLHWGTVPLIDFTSVAFGLGMILALDSWFSRGARAGLVIGSVASWLVLLIKVTTFPSMGVLLGLSAHLAIRRTGFGKTMSRVVIGLAMGPGVGLLAVITWTGYADRVKASSPLTSWLTSTELRGWNFATVAQRVDVDTYAVIAGRLGDQITGPGLLGLILATAVGIGLGQPRERILLCWSHVALVASPLIFLNLYFVHSYYLIAVYPIAISVIAIGASVGLRQVTTSWVRVLLLALVPVLAIAVVASTPRGRGDLAQAVHPAPPPHGSLVADLRQSTMPDDRVLLVGCDWDPSILYLSGRSGLMLRHEDDWNHVPGGYVPDYLASCIRGLDFSEYAPVGATLLPTKSPALFRVQWTQ